MPQRNLTAEEKAYAVITIVCLILLFGSWLFACGAFVYDAWHYDDPPTAAEIRWNARDNEWDRNMHDPTQRPPDSIAAEARMEMLLLEEKQ